MLQYINSYPQIDPDDTSLVSIVIPAHNEAGRIRLAVESVRNVFSDTGRAVEVIVVDDGSSDSTRDEAMELAAEYHDEVRVVSLAGNHGKGFAIRTGFSYTRGDLVGFIDADMEYPAAALPLMADMVERSNNGCAIASRVADDRKSWERYTSVAAHKLASMALQLPVTDTQAGMKMFPGEFARTALTSGREDGWLYDIEALLRAADNHLSIIEVPVMQKSVRRRRANLWAMLACGPSLMRMAVAHWQTLRRDRAGEVRQVARFGLVGIINSLADVAAYWALIRFWSPHNNGIQAGFESLLAWMFASLVGYALHSRYTFRRRLSASGFYVVTGIGVGIQVVTTGLVTQWLGSADALGGKLLGIALASMVTYFGYRFVARNSQGQSKAKARSFVTRANIPTIFPEEPSEAV